MRPSLPPAIEPSEQGYLEQRERAQSDKIKASMERKLHGRASPELRHMVDDRPAAASGSYDPHRW